MPKILLGFMGAGKTTIGRLLDPNFHDMDAELVFELGMPVAQYFAIYGEESFRSQETALLKRLLQEEGGVISTGGGLVMRQENLELLKTNPSNIFLKLDFEALYQRLQADKTHKRPLFLNRSKNELKALYDYRLPLYESCATHTIETGDLTPEEIAEKIRCL